MRLHMLLLLTLLLPGIAHASFAGTSTYFYELEPPVANVSIGSITVSSSTLYFGASTDFLVVLNNYGDLAANVSLNASIVNSTDGLVDTLQYDSVIVLPRSSSIIYKTWNTGANPVGLYLINATASYNDGANITNTAEKSFSILTPPIVQPGGGARSDSGGGYVAPPGVPVSNGSKFVPTPIPEIKPVTTGIRFLKTTILKEAGVGDSVFESFLLKNIGSGEKKLLFRVTGIPNDWMSYTPKEAVMLFSEERVINLGINIPTDALPGDYLLKLEAIEDKETAIDYMVLRIKPKPPNPTFPFVYKTIRLDRLKGETQISIDVQNGGIDPLSSILVSDEIIPPFKVSKEELKFENKPPKDILEGPPMVVRFEIVKLAPGELARISYSINAILGEYRPYIYWSTKQVEVMPRDVSISDLIIIRTISSTPVSEGGNSDVSALVFYAGFDTLKFAGVLEGPDGFEISPPSINDTLTPRGITILKYQAKVPRNSAGTHTVTLSLDVQGGYLIQGTGYINVQKPISLAITQVVFVVAAVLVIVMGFLYFFGKKKDQHERKKQVELREGYISEIKRHLKGK